MDYRSHWMLYAVILGVLLPSEAFPYHGDPITHDEASAKLEPLLEQNLRLSMAADSASSKFFCRYTYEKGIRKPNPTDWLGFSCYCQRDDDQYGIFMTSNLGYPLLYAAPNTWAGNGKTFLALVDDASREPMFAGGANLRVASSDLMHLRIEAGGELDSPGMDLDFKAMLDPLLKLKPDWYFSDTANQLTGVFSFGTVRVRFPRDQRPGRFPFAELSFENTTGYRATWSDFEIDYETTVHLTEPRLLNGKFSVARQMPPEVAEIVQNPLKFVRDRHASAREVEYWSLNPFLDFDSILGPRVTIQAAQQRRQQIADYSALQGSNWEEEEQADELLAETIRTLMAWHRRDSTHYDHETKVLSYVTGYEFERVAFRIEQRLGSRLFDGFRRALVEHALSQRSLESRCSAIRTLTLLGISDPDAWLFDSLANRFADSPPRLALHFIAFQILAGAPVRPRDIDQLRAGIANVADETEQLFMLSALCRLDRAKGLEELIAKFYATERLNNDTRLQRETTLPMIMASREGHAYFTAAVKTRSGPNAANLTEHNIMTMARWTLSSDRDPVLDNPVKHPPRNGETKIGP